MNSKAAAVANTIAAVIAPSQCVLWVALENAAVASDAVEVKKLLSSAGAAAARIDAVVDAFTLCCFEGNMELVGVFLSSPMIRSNSALRCAVLRGGVDAAQASDRQALLQRLKCVQEEDVDDT